MENHQPAQAGAPSPKPAILLVDDEPTCLRLLSSALADGDYQLLATTCAAEAMELARKHNPHLVLLDVLMPGMDGFAVCREFRADPATKNIPIIFLSGLQDARDRVRGIELGAVDFITKPFEPAEVSARVRRQVEIQKERRQWLQQAVAVTPQQRILDLISAGENDRTEFKSTLRWSLTDKKVDHGVELAWLKTVAAFLNSDGGCLLVGVSDQGLALGIEPDGFENEDKYLLHVNNRLQQHIGLEYAANTHFGLYPAGERKVLLIECTPASKPVFLTDAGQESFYVRVGPGSRKLSMSQMLTYVVERNRLPGRVGDPPAEQHAK